MRAEWALVIVQGYLMRHEHRASPELGFFFPYPRAASTGPCLKLAWDLAELGGTSRGHRPFRR